MGLKIAMVTSWNVRCGIASYTKNLATAIANLDHEVYIVRVIRFGSQVAEYFTMLAEKIPEDVDIIVISHEYGFFKNGEATFYNTLKQLYPDKPIVTIAHAVGNWGTDNIIADLSDKVIVHNHFCFSRFGHPDKTLIIHHGADPVECPPIDQCKKALGIDPRIPVVGYVGFISEYKGVETLIDAMVKVKGAALLIGGGWHTVSGPQRNYIMQLKERSLKGTPLEGRCKWIGYVLDEDLPMVYGASDLIVYPSRFATESGALIMALSHGKAVIANRLSAFKEKEKEGALTLSLIHI